MHSTTLIEFSRLIRRLKIPSSSTVMVHSSLLKFGIIEGGIKGLLKCIIDTLPGEPTIVMPTFSFSFSESRHWSANSTKSKMGALTEYFRTLNGVVRTIHPFHSVAAYGKHARDFSKCNSSSSFGKGSPFETLLELNAYNLSLGTEFIGGGTFCHHTEEVCKVPYRFYKEFPGSVYNEKNNFVNKIYKMYVRIIEDDYEYINNWDKVFTDLSNNNCFHIDSLNGAKIILTPMRKAHDSFAKLINIDSYYAADRVNKYLN